MSILLFTLCSYHHNEAQITYKLDQIAAATYSVSGNLGKSISRDTTGLNRYRPLIQAHTRFVRTDQNYQSSMLGPSMPSAASQSMGISRIIGRALYCMQHFLYFLPLPQGQSSFLPTFGVSRTMVILSEPPMRG